MRLVEMITYVYSVSAEKKFAFMFGKRILFDDYSSIPYGYLLYKSIKNVTLPFHHHFVMNVVGPSQSGKTFWMEKLLCELDGLVSAPIFYLYNGPFQELKIIMIC